MKIAVTGSTGLIGKALVQDLRSDGHDVRRLVRKEPSGADEVRWDPQGEVDSKALEGTEAVVHLAGAGVGDKRWTDAYKKQIYDSRVAGTRTLAEALAGLTDKPKVLLAGSAMGYYGDTGDREVDEDAPQGEGFLAGLVRDWEAAADPARDAGIRVAHSRTGLVLSAKGGLQDKLLPLFKLGLGGKLGSGRQWMSWITLADTVAALRFLIDNDVAGPVNVTAPIPVTNAVYTKALGRAVHRPAVFTVPEFALKIALGEFAQEGALVSQRVLPRRLTEAGFTFGNPDLGGALRALLAGR